MSDIDDYSIEERVHLIFSQIRSEPLGPKRFDLAKAIIQLGWGNDVSDDIVVKCLNLCLIVQNNEERIEAESTLFGMIEMVSKRKPTIFADLPKFFDVALAEPKYAVERSIICLRAISIDEAVLYPLRLQLIPFMKKALDKICAALPMQRSFVAVSVMKILVGWQKRRNTLATVKCEDGSSSEGWEVACVMKEIVDKVVENVDRQVTVKKEEDVDNADIRDIPAVYFEHIICILIRIGTTLHSVRRFGEPFPDPRSANSANNPVKAWAPQLKPEIFKLLSVALSQNFCRTDVKVKSDWFEYLIDQSKGLPNNQEKCQTVSEFYYTLYFFVEMFNETRDQFVLTKIIKGVERILTNVFEHKIVTVYPTAFLLTSRFFEFNKSKSGLDAAPHLYQHVMNFFRHFFTRLADPQTNFDLSFLKQIRVSSNFLATISKFQPDFIEGVSINFFVKAAEKIAHLFVRNVETNAENPLIYESPEYQNLLRSITSIVRIVTPCLNKASQEVCRNVSQSILMPAVPTLLPSHLVDRDLLQHVLVTLIPLLNGPAAPSYCVPLIHRLNTFRHLIFEQKDKLQPIFRRVIMQINASSTLRNTKLMMEIEPIYVVEQFKRDLKRATELKKEIVKIQRSTLAKDDGKDLREELNSILKKHLEYSIPHYINPGNLYEIPTLTALRAKLLDLTTDASQDEINELFLLAIYMIEECKKQPQAMYQRIREEERKVFKYYSEYLEKNVTQPMKAASTGKTVWNVDDVLNSANATLVTARALRYANAKQGQPLIQRFFRTVQIMLTAKAATTCEISKWSNYISIALDEVPIEHWSPFIRQMVVDLNRGTAADFLHRVALTFAHSQPLQMSQRLIDICGCQPVQDMLQEIRQPDDPCRLTFHNPDICLYKDLLEVSYRSDPHAVNFAVFPPPSPPAHPATKRLRQQNQPLSSHQADQKKPPSIDQIPSWCRIVRSDGRPSPRPSQVYSQEMPQLTFPRGIPAKSCEGTKLLKRPRANSATPIRIVQAKPPVLVQAKFAEPALPKRKYTRRKASTDSPEAAKPSVSLRNSISNYTTAAVQTNSQSPGPSNLPFGQPAPSSFRATQQFTTSQFEQSSVNGSVTYYTQRQVVNTATYQTTRRVASPSPLSSVVVRNPAQSPLASGFPKQEVHQFGPGTTVKVTAQQIRHWTSNPGLATSTGLANSGSLAQTQTGFYTTTSQTQSNPVVRVVHANQIASQQSHFSTQYQYYQQNSVPLHQPANMTPQVTRVNITNQLVQSRLLTSHQARTAPPAPLIPPRQVPHTVRSSIDNQTATYMSL